MKNLFLLLVLFLIAFLLYKFFKQFKKVKVGALSLITGGVKCGKSTLAVYLTLSEYKKRLRAVKFKNFFNKIFKLKLLEIPLIYSNIPLSVPYVELTENLIFRKERFRYGSVIYVNEASLLAQSTLIKDLTLNDRLLLFNKLIGHETKGGCCIYDTQCIEDLHFSIKRSLSSYFYIHHLSKLPFFIVGYVRELVHSEDSSTQNSFTEDIEDSMKKVLIPKKVWKYFDAYCYSCLTDDLPVNDKLLETEDLKARKILSFNERINRL